MQNWGLAVEIFMVFFVAGATLGPPAFLGLTPEADLGAFS